jgi:hypothetical protein
VHYPTGVPCACVPCPLCCFVCSLQCERGQCGPTLSGGFRKLGQTADITTGWVSSHILSCLCAWTCMPPTCCSGGSSSIGATWLVCLVSVLSCMCCTACACYEASTVGTTPASAMQALGCKPYVPTASTTGAPVRVARLAPAPGLSAVQQHGLAQQPPPC